jgi:arginyl-tRNA synthetase
MYCSTAPFGIPGTSPLEVARALAGRLGAESWIALAEATGTGYLTITVTRGALDGLSARIVAAGPDCVRSDALLGEIVSVPPPADIAAAETWQQAHAALAAELIASLSLAAGATPAPFASAQPGAARVSMSHRPPSRGIGDSSTTAEPGAEGALGQPPHAVAWAGEEAIRFALASIPPGQPVRIDPETLARHLPSNPAFAVRYAHARAASVPRWAAAGVPRWAAAADPGAPVADPRAAAVSPANTPQALTDPELALVGQLSWLPERVAIAARRGRPDEFARYLAELANATTVTIGPASNLELAAAARTSLAAGLGLLRIAAPDRL